LLPTSVQINPQLDSEVQVNTLTKPYSLTQTSTIRSPDTMADTARDAVDAVNTKVGDALDRGQAAVSYAGEMAGTATQQMKTLASELEAMAKRNPLGTVAGAVVVGVLIGLLARGRTA
jgi:ElaB/YqjD/DUF883 family membrane-anchored ribosome-binding protein